MIVGLLSLFTIIALNVTNIIFMTESGGTMESIKNNQHLLSGSMKETTGILIEDLKPKTDLINSMVSFNIPSQLSLIYGTLKNEVLKQCTPSFMFNNTICPISEHPTHSSYFEEVNLQGFTMCRSPHGRVVLNSNITFVEYPSFIPGPTKPGSCVKLPSFSLSDTIFAYSHTIMGHGCSELDVGDHYFSLGRIADHGNDQPVFETLIEWFINDKINRRSCTVAAGMYGAWMGCVVMTESFLDDLSSQEVGKISISYLDVYGRKREWLYSKSEVRYDQNYASLYFSVGSGVVIGDTVYFLVWGSLVFPIETDAFCQAPDCSSYTQTMCNQAQRPQVFGYNQMVNGILSFKMNIDGKPILSVRTFSPKLIPFGTEGRLMRFNNVDRTYIYLRSTSWHAWPMTGIVSFEYPLNIEWIEQRATSRPGQPPCDSTSRCPRQCVTGVYTDVFPLSLMYEYSMTVFLDSRTTRINPTLSFSNTTKSIYRQTLTNTTQRADYTTTTCFTFKLRVWCVSIVELTPSTITSFEPVPFLYQLDVGCKSTLDGSIKPLSDGSKTMKLGPFRDPRNECYFEQMNNNYYFIISTPSSIQAYSIRDTEPDRIPHAAAYISDICPLAIKIYNNLSKSARLVTSIVIGNWQFRPVTIQGGVRANITMNKIRTCLGAMTSPEDPGNNYYSGHMYRWLNINDVNIQSLSTVCKDVIKYTDNLSLQVNDTTNTTEEELIKSVADTLHVSYFSGTQTVLNLTYNCQHCPNLHTCRNKLLFTEYELSVLRNHTLECTLGEDQMKNTTKPPSDETSDISITQRPITKYTKAMTRHKQPEIIVSTQLGESSGDHNETTITTVEPLSRTTSGSRHTVETPHSTREEAPTNGTYPTSIHDTLSSMSEGATDNMSPSTISTPISIQNKSEIEQPLRVEQYNVTSEKINHPLSTAAIPKTVTSDTVRDKPEVSTEPTTHSTTTAIHASPESTTTRPKIVITTEEEQLSLRSRMNKLMSSTNLEIQNRISSFWNGFSQYFDREKDPTPASKTSSTTNQALLEDTTGATATLLMSNRKQSCKVSNTYPLPATDPCKDTDNTTLCLDIRSIKPDVGKLCDGVVFWGDLSSLAGYINITKDECLNATLLRQTSTFYCQRNKTIYIENLRAVHYPINLTLEQLDNTWKETSENTSIPFYFDFMIGVYPFSYKEIMDWGSKYYTSLHKPFCGIGFFCGFPFLLYRSDEKQVLFEVYEIGLRHKIDLSSRVRAYDICQRIFVDMSTNNHTHNIFLRIAIHDRNFILSSLEQHMFIKVVGTPSSCDSYWWNRMYYTTPVKTEVLKKLPNQIGEQLTTRNRRELSTKRRRTDYDQEIFEGLIGTDLNGLWF